jgi:hypothetical protein
MQAKLGKLGNIIVVTALSLTPGLLHAQFDFKIAGAPTQIHSFASEGFAYSDQNNFLTMKTSDGSFAMTDAGSNISVRFSDRLRVGAQVYIANVGELNKWHPQLDWALVDYRFKDWFGVRAGKVKTALGLYNDVQDMEFLHVWALLPQGLYPVDLRDNTIAHVGGDIYGTINLKKAGSLGYTGYAGRAPTNRYGGYYLSASEAGDPFNSMTTFVWGADFRWNTNVPGLLVGASWMDRTVKVNANVEQYGGAPMHIETNPDHTTGVYADYTLGKLHLSAEGRRHREVAGANVFGQISSSDLSEIGWFVAGSYRIAKRLELGTYYSRYNVDQASAPGNAANHIYDNAVTARFDITRFWHVKVEGHFMDGYGDLYSAHGFYSISNPTGLKPTTNMLVIRTGFSL